MELILLGNLLVFMPFHEKQCQYHKINARKTDKVLSLYDK